MSNRYQNETPGPWEIDENGRRFRRVGHGCIEYPMQITTSYGTFDADNMPTPAKEVEPPHPKSWGKCPFASKCTSQCALYGETGCALVTGEGSITGKRCPFGDQHSIFMCAKDCALWTLCNRKENER